MIDSVTISKSLSPTQVDRLEKLAERINRLNANLIVFDPSGNCVMNCPCGQFGSDIFQFAEYAQQAYQAQSEEVCHFGTDGRTLAMVLKAGDAAVAVAVVDMGQTEAGRNEDLSRLCLQYNIDYLLLEKALKQSGHEYEYFNDTLVWFAEEFRTASKATQQLEIVSTELTQTYEELMLLHNMSKHMEVTQSNAAYLQMACDQITNSVNVEGIAIFLEKVRDGDKDLIMTAGSGMVLIDRKIADFLQSRLVEELNDEKEALLDSEINSSFKYDWPEKVRNIIAVPLYGSDRMIGLMVATNTVDKPDFDNIDVKLFNSVANQCAVFMENGRLFGDLKDLFIGSLKALTNSIDAKDQYTRGHSERVAIISRWIAERIAEDQSVEDEQIHRIYLAGLLHDIGKIGIDEVVLSKKGTLTEEDMAQIKLHPQTGAAILADIKQMNDLMPGILYHHERIDGNGYPEGLAGEAIPLMGKIIGLADAFDAMTSKRIYRDAMSTKRALNEIRKNLGTQFDEQIGIAFIESDVSRLWSIIHDGFIEHWDYSNFSEYGAEAVGTLIR